MNKFNLGGLKIAVICASFIMFAFPMFISAESGLGAADQTLSGLLGEPCLVPIFHTQFAFPPEGGQVIKTSGGSMYFVRDYLPGCEDAGRNGAVISSGTRTNAFPANQTSTTQVSSATTRTYTAPKTGCQ